MTGPDPLATGVGLSASYLRSPYVLATFSNVPVERMEEVEERVDAVVREQMEEGAFDLGRMRNLSQWGLFKVNAVAAVNPCSRCRCCCCCCCCFAVVLATMK